jgi:hypothetical protein
MRTFSFVLAQVGERDAQGRDIRAYSAYGVDDETGRKASIVFAHHPGHERRQMFRSELAHGDRIDPQILRIKSHSLNRQLANTVISGEQQFVDERGGILASAFEPAETSADFIGGIQRSFQAAQAASKRASGGQGDPFIAIARTRLQH